jgi:hypothetical protein
VSGPSTTEATILALLVDDVSDADLRDALTRLLTAAGDEDQRLRIEQLGQLAFELHRARSDDRRRALGLTALSDTATDLAAHLEVDELLAAICRRARLLLGTDVAYVTLRDEVAGDTYVHATDGIVSEAFRTMRLPTGTGLGGLVAQTGRPETTADYSQHGRLEARPEPQSEALLRAPAATAPSSPTRLRGRRSCVRGATVQSRSRARARSW